MSFLADPSRIVLRFVSEHFLFAHRLSPSAERSLILVRRHTEIVSSSKAFCFSVLDLSLLPSLGLSLSLLLGRSLLLSLHL